MTAFLAAELAEARHIATLRIVYDTTAHGVGSGAPARAPLSAEPKSFSPQLVPDLEPGFWGR